MNYRHAFHAGNHGDVLKHAVLARLLWRLAQKDKPFAVLDAYAGLGIYDLDAEAPSKTREWEGGVGKIGGLFSAEVEAVLAPYRTVLRLINQHAAQRFYPGSPEIALRIMREGDRLVANELNPKEAALLRQNYMGESRLQVSEADALAAVKLQLPFRERRGLTILDPPYEGKDETARVTKQFAEAARRMPTGVVMTWYPVTTDDFVSQLVAGFKATGISNQLRAELRVKHTHEASGLSGSGLIIWNPPYQLEQDMRILLPALASRLGIEGLGRFTLEWLTAPKA
jgi:23S rRNA (adenine2030-N6)-methyltransferase